MGSLIGLELDRLVAAVGLGAARTVPVAWMVPAFGGPHVPAQIRVALGVALGVLCLPVVAGQVPLDAGATWALLVVREVAVGVTLGFVASAMFHAAESAGRLVDILRGANMAEVLSPVSEGRTSPLGDLTLLLAVVIFLEIGGLGHVATALARSYEAVPLAGSAGPPQWGRAVEVVIFSAAKLFEAALGLAAPALVALLLADVALGAIGRVAPQVPLYFVGMPLKALLGVGVVLVSLGSIQAVLVGGTREWLGLLERALASWR